MFRFRYAVMVVLIVLTCAGALKALYAGATEWDCLIVLFIQRLLGSWAKLETGSLRDV